MKKFFNVLLSIILTVLLMILISSIGIKSTLTKILSETFTQKQISEYILDEIFYDYDTDILIKLGNEIRSSSYIDKITEKFLNNIISNIVNNKNENLVIKNELNNIIDSKLTEISQSQREKIKAGVDKVNFNELEDKLTINVKNNLTPMELTILKIYNILSNTWFRIIIFLLIVFNIIGIVVINNNILKTINKIGVSCIVSSIIIIFGIIAVKLGSIYLSNTLLGRTTDINMNLIIILTMLDLVIGLGFTIIKSVYSKKEQNS